MSNERLGTPDPAGAVQRMGRALKAKTSQFAANVLPIIREIQCAGHTSCNAIAGQLNARKVATAHLNCPASPSPARFRSLSVIREVVTQRYPCDMSVIWINHFRLWGCQLVRALVRQARAAQSAFKLFDGTCQGFAEHWIIPFQRFREDRFNVEAIEQNYRVLLLAAEMMQLQTKGLDFRGGEGVEHRRRE